MTSATLLAFDTSTERLALALVHGDTVDLLDEPGGARASARLVPAVLERLTARRLTLRDVEAFAFGRGPGAFTGLRTACSVAQGFAFGTGRPVLPLDSLALVAEDARAQLGRPAVEDLWVAMDARMDEVYAARYAFDGGAWVTTLAPALYTLEALNARWRDAPPSVVAGSALSTFGDRLALGSARRVEPEGSRAAALARLAQAAWRAGRALPAHEALPLYLRDKVALTTAERDAAREARRTAPVAPKDVPQGAAP